MIGLTSYVPTFLDGALSTSPLVAGLALAALTVGWPISASQAGRFYLRIGFKSTALIGISVTVLGVAILALTSATPNVALVAGSCFVVGLGLGLVATPTLIAAQSSVPWNERGVVTSTNLFARSIGSALGVAAFGAVANAVYAGPSGGTEGGSNVVAASGAVFLSVLVCAVLAVAAVIAMPATPVTSDSSRQAFNPDTASESP
jgi:MFS family permease